MGCCAEKSARSRRGDGDDLGVERTDAASCASSSTMASLRDLRDLDAVGDGALSDESPLERCIDALYEKRRAAAAQACDAQCWPCMHYWVRSSSCQHSAVNLQQRSTCRC